MAEFTEQEKNDMLNAIEGDAELIRMRDEIEPFVLELAKKYVPMVERMATHMPESLRRSEGQMVLVRPLVDGLASSIGAYVMDQVEPGWQDKARERMLRGMLAALMSEAQSEPDPTTPKTTLH